MPKPEEASYKPNCWPASNTQRLKDCWQESNVVPGAGTLAANSAGTAFRCCLSTECTSSGQALLSYAPSFTNKLYREVQTQLTYLGLAQSLTGCWKDAGRCSTAHRALGAAPDCLHQTGPAAQRDRSATKKETRLIVRNVLSSSALLLRGAVPAHGRREAESAVLFSTFQVIFSGCQTPRHRVLF